MERMVHPRTIRKRAKQAARSRKFRHAEKLRRAAVEAELHSIQHPVAELDEVIPPSRDLPVKAHLFDALAQMRDAFDRPYTLLPRLLPWTGEVVDEKIGRY